MRMQLPPVLIAVILALLFSQGLKIVLLLAVHKQRFHWTDMVVTGGMPSAHTAIVVSLMTSVWFTEGLSNLFILCLVLAAIVIRDALGVRRTAGEEGKMINRIIAATKLKARPVRYSLGHTPKEVTVGAILGLLAGSVVLFL